MGLDIDPKQSTWENLFFSQKEVKTDSTYTEMGETHPKEKKKKKGVGRREMFAPAFFLPSGTRWEHTYLGKF